MKADRILIRREREEAATGRGRIVIVVYINHNRLHVPPS